jgi:hypothetical protein
LLERPDVADPFGIDAHHVQGIGAVRLAVLAATSDTRHREQFAAQLARNIVGRQHDQFDQALELLRQFRPAEEFEVLAILIFVIGH